MPVVRIVLLLLFLAVITPGIGAGICNYIKEYKRNVAFHFLAGFLAEWALFQLIAVPAIVMGATLTGLSVVYGILLGLCFIAGVAVTAADRKKTPALKVVREPFSKGEKRLWAIALAGILLQLVLAVVMAFEDGDDAFYVTTSNLSVTWDSMYRLLPYNFGSTSLDFRHCLAPFPIWIAFLSKLSGIHPDAAYPFAPCLLHLRSAGIPAAWKKPEKTAGILDFCGSAHFVGQRIGLYVGNVFNQPYQTGKSASVRHCGPCHVFAAAYAGGTASV